jgi:hypothetical protein
MRRKEEEKFNETYRAIAPRISYRSGDVIAIRKTDVFTHFARRK